MRPVSRTQQQQQPLAAEPGPVAPFSQAAGGTPAPASHQPQAQRPQPAADRPEERAEAAAAHAEQPAAGGSPWLRRLNRAELAPQPAAASPPVQAGSRARQDAAQLPAAPAKAEFHPAEPLRSVDESPVLAGTSTGSDGRAALAPDSRASSRGLQCGALSGSKQQNRGAEQKHKSRRRRVEDAGSRAGSPSPAVCARVRASPGEDRASLASSQLGCCSGGDAAASESSLSSVNQAPAAAGQLEAAGELDGVSDRGSQGGAASDAREGGWVSPDSPAGGEEGVGSDDSVRSAGKALLRAGQQRRKASSSRASKMTGTRDFEGCPPTVRAEHSRDGRNADLRSSAGASPPNLVGGSQPQAERASHSAAPAPTSVPQTALANVTPPSSSQPVAAHVASSASGVSSPQAVPSPSSAQSPVQPLHRRRSTAPDGQTSFRHSQGSPSRLGYQQRSRSERSSIDSHILAARRLLAQLSAENLAYAGSGEGPCRPNSPMSTGGSQGQDLVPPQANESAAAESEPDRSRQGLARNLTKSPGIGGSPEAEAGQLAAEGRRPPAEAAVVAAEAVEAAVAPPEAPSGGGRSGQPRRPSSNATLGVKGTASASVAADGAFSYNG